MTWWKRVFAGDKNDVAEAQTGGAAPERPSTDRVISHALDDLMKRYQGLLQQQGTPQQQATPQQQGSASFAGLSRQILEDAEREADRIRMRARQEADVEAGRILTDAKREAQQTLGDARQKAQSSTQTEVQNILQAAQKRAQIKEKQAQQMAQLFLVRAREDVQKFVTGEANEAYYKLLSTLQDMLTAAQSIETDWKAKTSELWETSPFRLGGDNAALFESLGPGQTEVWPEAREEPQHVGSDGPTAEPVSAAPTEDTVDDTEAPAGEEPEPAPSLEMEPAEQPEEQAVHLVDEEPEPVSSVDTESVQFAEEEAVPQPSAEEPETSSSLDVEAVELPEEPVVSLEEEHGPVLSQDAEIVEHPVDGPVAAAEWQDQEPYPEAGSTEAVEEAVGNEPQSVEGAVAEEPIAGSADIYEDEEEDVIVVEGDTVVEEETADREEAAPVVDMSALFEAESEVELVLKPLAEMARIVKFYGLLQNIDGVKVRSTTGSWDQGTTINIMLDRPLPLYQIFAQLPEVMQPPARPSRMVFSAGWGLGPRRGLG